MQRDAPCSLQSDEAAVTTKPRLLDDLPPAQLDQIFRRLRSKRSERAADLIPRRDDAAALPLSFGQQRLWLLDQLAPGGAAYVISAAIELAGDLEPAALWGSFLEIARRHETLRTAFLESAGEPVQAIAPKPELPSCVVDLSALAAAGSRAETERIARETARQGFDLSTAPLWRLRLLRLRADLHVALLSLHHAVADGWSIGILVKELAELYAAALSGRPPRLPELPIQYADFALWQRRRLTGEVLAADLAFWREQLGGLPSALEVPADRPRPATPSDRGIGCPMELGRETSEAVRRLARDRGATAFMVLLAAFQALLGRLAGEDDLAVGVPVAGRDRTEVAGLIGFFVNTLVLRARLGGDPPFDELVARVREGVVSAFAHRELPFERLIDDLSPRRHLGVTPLFQVAFTFQSSPSDSLELPGLRLTPLELAESAAKFDLTLALAEREGRFTGSLSGRTDLFDRTTVERLVSRLGRLLRAALEAPGAQLSDLPLLSEAESHALRIEWNATEVSFPTGRCLHEFVEAQVDRTPEEIAVVFAGRTLTYGELDRRASILARRLREAAVGPEVVVGIAAERSLDLPVALFAILKAGGAYLPLDPSYPRERLAYMLESARAPVLLAQRRLADRLPAHAGRTLWIEDEPPAIVPSSRIASGASPDNLAYIIYTSGSTGRPKGAMNTHRGIVNRLLWMQAAYELDAADRVLQKTPMGFDVSVWELFWPLLAGARLVLAEPGGHQDGAYLARLIGEEGVTTLHFVPSMLAAFLEQPDLAACGSLARVIASGEALALEHQERFFARLTAELHNLYGPTEAAVDVTAWACERGGGRRTVPIGRPIANLQIHLLDPDLQPVPIGVTGHLHIGGVGLARGYSDRPDLTAERFVPDPSAGRPGSRLYATGDLARYGADGAIAYLGRLDHQVKLRGFRIELGEIEAALREHPGLAEASVAALDLGREDRRLVAYAVPDASRAPAVRRELALERDGRLAGLLRAELPNGMSIVLRSRAEVDFVYREIFEQQTYLRHGITLADGDTVFDVGANVGLFTLFAGRAAAAAKVYAFEPIPQLFELLVLNAELHGVDLHAVPCGLANEPGRARFTYYPDNSILSGRYADAARERSVVLAYERRQRAAAGDEEVSEALLGELVAERLTATEVEAELRTLSQVIAEAGVERIDLLKIDVEKSERDVLEGISESDWPKIRQVVAEVHDDDGRLAWTVSLLASHGFEVACEREDELEETPLCCVYAVRPEARRKSPWRERPAEPSWESAERLRSDVRSALAARLPEYMVPSALVFLEAMPLSPNGKVDRRLLPAPASTQAVAHVAPRTAVEERLAAMWAELLGCEQVGVEDDFFALGGHSLLGMRLIARVRAELDVDLPLRRLFERPTVAGLAVAIERAGGGARSPAGLAVEPLPRDAVTDFPLSFSQERLWFLDRLDPGNPAFDMPIGVELRGELDVTALGSALAELVARQESLRTTFPVVAGQPVQRVAVAAALLLASVDLTALPPQARSAEAERLTAESAQRHFDLARGPLVAAALVRLAPDRHRFLLVVHHIVSDGWSIGVMMRDLAALYAGSTLPPLPVQYADFSVWQRRALEARRAEDVAYWMARLGGTEPLELPTDRPRPAERTYRGGTRRRSLQPALADRLRAFSRAEGATVFMTLLAALQAVLARWTGQIDVVVGTPVAGRSLVETEGLVGFFLNILALRTDLSGEPSLRGLVARVREVAVGAFSHQDVPFEALLAQLGGERDGSRTPLFQVFFNMLTLPVTDIRLPALTLELLPLPDPLSKFDMTFYVTEDARAGLGIELVYNADLFDGERMEELVDQLAFLCAQALERSDAPVTHLSLRTPRAAALLPNPAAELDASWVGAVHDLFDAQAQRAPERRAIADREGAWTYGELSAASDRVARWLAGHGRGRGERVAIFAHRSAPLAQAVLGTLKAGAALVLLDPAYPPSRLVEILELTAPSAWIEIAAAGPPPPAVDAWLAAGGKPRLALPGGGAAAGLAHLAAWAGERPAVAVGPDEVAVVTLTSGSTGKPKGVLGRHGPLSHFLPWMTERFGLSADDRVSLLSGLAHDPLQRDLFTPLALGAAVAVPDPDSIGVPGRLVAWMAEEGVTVVHLTPAMGQVLAERPPGSPVQAPSLRLVFLVGDALTRLDVAKIRAVAPRATCVNLYGSTETQRAVGFHIVEETDTEAAAERAKQVLPLGRGMKDIQLLVLNRAGDLAGVGEVGEIAVRSPHLAAGYLGDPELTAARFQANPSTGRQEDRIYRSGDLGRYLPNGEVTFAGRADLQLKIRGFRIEPAEIEAALRAHPRVREAVVVARDDERAGKLLVAYVVAEEEGAVDVADLRLALRGRLPAYMVPAAFVALPRIPLTPNGKVDRRALSAPREPAACREAPLESDLERRIAAVWREVLGIEEVGVEDNFFDVGGHSLLLVRLHGRLAEALERDLSLIELFRHPSIRAQARLVACPAEAAERREVVAPPRRGTSGTGRIAIVGMAGKFPKAADLAGFWENLRAGVDAVSTFSTEELSAAGTPAALVGDARYVPARGVLEGADLFDAGFFDCSPLQAQIMDPQLRLLLECAWESLENAGYDPPRYRGAIGVYAGSTLSTYFLHNLWSNPELLTAVGAYQMAIATDRDYLTTQVSYRLNLRGPSVNVQTACSTSLVAVHLACQALLMGQCDMALAGGVSIKVPQVSGYLYQEGGIDSLAGRCRAFDARADGTVYGGGLGLVVLKRLEEALADDDTIHAVILGSATNNDGAGKVGYTAPSIEGQEAVILAAQAAAGVPADSITYLEAHGTGTQLGDPIEVEALRSAFRRSTGRTGFCALGSVKTNVGHLGAAAGVAGLLKTVLALEHAEIPPSIHFATPNPRIDFASSPFRLAASAAEWRADGPRRAGVSSFGLGGTNAHVVVEEAPPPPLTASGRTWQVLPLSAQSAPALEAATDRLAAWLGAHPEASLADVAHTLQVGRRELPYRRAVVARDGADAARALAARAPSDVLDAHAPAGKRPVAFLFPGQGAQHVNMGRGLYESEPVFRRELDACSEALAPRLGRRLVDLLYPGPKERERALSELGETRYAQPALFAVEYALARLLIAWGIAPAAMLGHSLGEYVAACLAGVLPLADALDLVAERGRLMQSAPRGAMLSVQVPAGELAARLPQDVSLAAANGPSQSVASGPEAVVAALAEQLARAGIASRRLPVSHAFHSAAMDAVLAPFGERVRRIALAPPAIPYLSNLTGDWILSEEATDPESWVNHLRRPVLFAGGAARLAESLPGVVLVEVGPGSALGKLVRGLPGAPLALAAMRGPRDPGADEAKLYRALAGLWLAGVEIDWERSRPGEPRRRIPLPTYPFERKRYWVEPGRSAAGGLGPPASRLRARSWRPAAPPSRAAAPGPWLLFDDGGELGARVDEILARRGIQAVTVRPGRAFAGSRETGYEIHPGRAADYVELVARLAELGDLPERFVYGWSVARTAAEAAEKDRRGLGAVGLHLLGEALGCSASGPLRICAVSSHLHALSGEDTLPERAALLGVCARISAERPSFLCRSLDVPAMGAPEALARLADRLVDDVALGIEPVVAYTPRAQRWVRGLDPEEPGERAPRALGGGICLQVGEVDGWGNAFSEALAGYGIGLEPLTDETDADTALAAAAALARNGPLAGLVTWIGGAPDGSEGAGGGLENTLAFASHRLHAMRDVAREHHPAFCLVLAAKGDSAAAAAAAAFGESFAAREAQEGWPWTTLCLGGGAASPAVAAEALRRVFAVDSVESLVVTRPAPPFEVECARERQAGPAVLPRGPHSAALPRTDAEARVRALFAQLLGVDEIGGDDDFFALGGDSLMATRLVTRLRDEFAVELPLEALFALPTPAGLAARIAEKSDPLSTLPTVSRRARDADLRLSFSQERLWFLAQLAPDSPAYNIPLAVRLRDGLDAPALARSLEEVARRHEVLRTTFPVLDGAPVQRIAPPRAWSLPVVELGALRGRAREAEALRLAAAEARAPFDLARGPLVRSRLIRLGTDDHLLVLVLHHTVVDGWSLGLLMDEVGALYPSFTGGLASSLPDLEIQYADYAGWQRRYLTDEALAGAIAHWRALLTPEPPALELPIDRQRSALETLDGARQELSLSARLAGAAALLAQRRGATLFMVLLAAWQAVLGRWTGQEDLTVGFPVAGRTRKEVEGLIGLFVNTLVSRGNLAGDPSFEDLLGRVRQAALGAYAHQEVPFEKVVEAVRPTRSLGRSPLFQSMFVLQNAPRRSLETSGLVLEPWPLDSATSQFELSLLLSQEAEGLVGALEYRRDLFDAASLRRMARQLELLIEGAIARPGCPLSELPLLSEGERHQLLEWNDTAAAQPASLLHELFEDRAARAPDAIAVVAATGESLTYGETNRRADRLAAFLHRSGTAAEARIGLCLERSPAALIAILGVLKAGAAYVPLDPAYPPARLAYMLADAGASLLVTQERLAGRFAEDTVRTLCIDPSGDPLDASSHGSARAPRVASAEAAAYVIYTSGSTGQPKGVVVAHRAVVNLCATMADRYGLVAGDRVLQFAPLGFDVSIEQIFPSWSRGAAVVLGVEGRSLSVPEFLGLVEERGITVLSLPSTYWHEWMSELSAHPDLPLPPSLRLLSTGDDRLLPERLQTWVERVGERVLWANAYGPTEAAVTATLEGPRRWHEGTPVRMLSVPIGRPIENVRLHLLDRRLHPVGIGVTGQVYIGGRGLARGYAGRPDVTAERFLPDPRDAEPGARLYATGDLAHYLPDGRIDFLGRSDRQVKIRGFRIEVGEVEGMLAQHPRLAQAAVAVAAGPSGSRRLVACTVSRAGAAPSSGELRAFLAERLPEHMVPSLFSPQPSARSRPPATSSRARRPRRSSRRSGARFSASTGWAPTTTSSSSAATRSSASRWSPAPGGQACA
jgi:amino acid adenylation domain-containing protein/FkbM family methyltransferase